MAGNQRTMSHHDRRRGAGLVQAEQESQDADYGAGNLRNCVPHRGVSHPEDGEGAVDWETMEESWGREESSGCDTSDLE